METIKEFDLILSGHSHGGQIRIGNWRLRNKGSSSADAGLYQLNDRTKLYVNRGIGLTFLPIRFGVASRNCVLLHLKKSVSNFDRFFLFSLFKNLLTSFVKNSVITFLLQS